MSTLYTPEAQTKRVWRTFPPRPVEFVDIGADVAGTLAAIRSDTETVFVVGPRPAAGWVAWSLTGLGPWVPDNHYHEGAHPVMRYTHRDTRRRPGRRVAVYPADTWFAGASYTTTEARTAYRHLGALVRGAFGNGAALLATPATTGRELFLRTIPHRREWPVLPADLRAEVFAPAGQARVETFGAPFGLIGAPPRAAGLYEYDGRLMYAALCWGLGAGIPERDTSPEFVEHARGRYLVAGCVPKDWPHRFGLVGVREESGAMRYPHEPGEPFAAWIDGAELQLVLAQGWPVNIRERVLFPTYAGKGPLDVWAEKLIGLHARAGRLERAALRSLILHSIGAFHTSGHAVTRITDDPERVPAEHRRHMRREAGLFLWPETRPARWVALAHPEWSAAVWARARRRLIDAPGAHGTRAGALHAAGDVVAFSTDAIYLTERQAWPDDGKPGRFRLKRWTDQPTPWPAGRTDLLRIRNQLPNQELST